MENMIIDNDEKSTVINRFETLYWNTAIFCLNFGKALGFRLLFTSVVH